MCFKRKKYVGEIYTQDRKTILLAAQEVDVLMALDRHDRYKDKLIALKDELLYLSPRDSQEIYEMDKKISDKVGDLKLILNKRENIDDDNVFSLIENIFVNIRERDAKELK